MRVYAISDLHVDYEANFKWVEGLSNVDYQQDAIIVAGDLTHDLSLLAKTLMLFKTKFAEVYFTPGNHDLWIRSTSAANSIEKLMGIIKLCNGLEINVSPKSYHNVFIAPIISWYTQPQEGPDSLFHEKIGEDPTLSMWNDKYLIKWPFFDKDQRPVDYLLAMNESTIRPEIDQAVITFSHFLPRSELLKWQHRRFGFDPVPSFNFSRVAGSQLIDKHLRLLGSKAHIYGHQHRNQAIVLEGVTYISACLGYPQEHYNRAIWELENGPLMVWDTDTKLNPLPNYGFKE